MREAKVSETDLPRRYVSPENQPVSPIEFDRVSQRMDRLDDDEHGRVPKLEADMSLMKDRWARLGGVGWALVVLNGLFAFIATLASIYVAFKK